MTPLDTEDVAMATAARRENADDMATRWPQEGDRFFEDTGLAKDTYLAGDSGERSYRLPKGYKLAGDVLIERIATDSVEECNLIYPALFCYRQSLELFLKTILDRFDKRAKNTHNLKSLWEAFLLMLKEREQEHADGLAAVERLILEMHEADQRSDAFRFSTDASGALFAFGDRRLDVARLAETMQGLQNFFECCYLVLWEQDERQ
jgi:hypothetical protein